MDTINSTTKRAKGKHLTATERGRIQSLHEEGYSIRQIARRVGVSRSTVSNELRRGTPERKGNRGRKPQYIADRAQKGADERSHQKRGPYGLKKCPEFLAWLKTQVEENNWSFDVCVNIARIQNLFPDEKIPCVKTLYNWLHAGELDIDMFKMPEILKRNSKNTRRTAQPKAENKTNLGKSIDERPDVVETRTEFGHWEIDSVIGLKYGRDCTLMTILEKMTHKLIALKLPCKTAQAMGQGIKALKEYFGEAFNLIFKTITADNGCEFATLSETCEELGTDVYFAHPYTSIERAQNERHNREIRRFIPKGTAITPYSADEILEITETINNTPRRSLDFRTANDLFEEQLDLIYSE